MKYFLLILFLLCCFGTQAQEKDDFKRFGVGINYSIVNRYHYYKSELLPNNSGIHKIGDSISNNFNQGLVFQFNINKNIFLQSGIQYEEMDYLSKWIYFPERVDEIIGYRYAVNYYNYNFPFSINFQTGYKKLQFSSGIGLIISHDSRTISYAEYYVDSNLIIHKFGEPWHDMDPNWNYYPIIKLGFNYNFSPKIKFNYETIYKQVSSINEEGQLFKDNWYDLYFNFSLIYSFN